MLKKLNAKKIWIISLGFICVAALILSVSMTRSKYVSIEHETGKIQLEEFEIQPILYSNASGQKTVVAPQSQGNYKYYELPASEFENLSLDIVYYGRAITNTRFKFDVMWYKKNGSNYDLIFHSYPDYTYNDSLIYDNFEKDGWYYFKENTTASDMLDGTKTYNVFTDIQSGNNVHDPVNPTTDIPDTIRIYITIDSVQYNRSLELWGMTEFPWETT